MRSMPALHRFIIAIPLLFLAACQDLPDALGPDPASTGAGGPGGAAHRAQDLRAWFARSAPEVMALPMTVFADHDEARNVLVFGVENAAAIQGIERALSRIGVPATAYRVQVTEPIVFMSDNLRSAHRPTVGGLQIHWGNYVCTLGFNVDHAGGRSFVTNSHCTDRQGTTGTTQYFQPSSSAEPGAIAVEAHDPSYSRIAGCSGGKVCRYSDAARALYNAGTASTRGLIAKTSAPNNGSLAVTGHFSITAQDNGTTSFPLGTTMNKVGRTTGWGQGEVTNTCATVNVSGSNIQLLCQTIVQRSGSVIVQGGDSGSPVFRVTSSDNVTLVGILWGGNTSGDLFVFSPLKNIQDELGGVTATFDGSGGGTGPGDGDGDGDTPCTPRGKSGNCK